MFDWQEFILFFQNLMQLKQNSILNVLTLGAYLQIYCSYIALKMEKRTVLNFDLKLSNTFKVYVTSFKVRQAFDLSASTNLVVETCLKNNGI